MKMKNNESAAAGKKRAAGTVLLVLSVYSALAFAVLLIFGKMIPSPLAEYIAFSYSYGAAGEMWLCVLFALLYLLSAALCALMFTDRFGKSFPLRVLTAVLVFADFAVHAYAFLAASGYQWIYLICALLDGVMIFCLLYRPKSIITR